MSAQTLLSGGDKWFSYSGVVFGDVSAPASIQLILIPNTGLRDTLVQIYPNFGLPVITSTGNQLGISVKINDVEVIHEQDNLAYAHSSTPFQLFVPRQSKLEVISLNTSGNNTQKRNCNLIGYYL